MSLTAFVKNLEEEYKKDLGLDHSKEPLTMFEFWLIEKLHHERIINELEKEVIKCKPTTQSPQG